MAKRRFIIDQTKCISCGTCEVECRKKAILISSKGKFSIDYEKCVGCGICAEVCPMDAAMEDPNGVA